MKLLKNLLTKPQQISNETNTSQIIAGLLEKQYDILNLLFTVSLISKSRILRSTILEPSV